MVLKLTPSFSSMGSKRLWGLMNWVRVMSISSS